MPKDLITLTLSDITILSIGYKRRREVELSDLRLLLAEIRNSSLNAKSITKPTDIIKLDMDKKQTVNDSISNEQAEKMFLRLLKKPNQ